jgi:undecaprenyl-diphosphatase
MTEPHRPRWGGRGPAFVAAGAASLLVGAFLELTKTVLQQAPGSTLQAADRALLLSFAGHRAGWLNATALDLTALGSPVVLVLFVSALATAFAAFGRRHSAAILVAAGLGAAALTAGLKHVFERARPDVVPALVHVSGFSYPSGHSLAAASVYATAAVLVALRAPTRRLRVAVGLAAALLLVAIGSSRVYLGVHYPSDVVAGFSAGLGWAFVLLAVAAWRRGPRDQPRA